MVSSLALLALLCCGLVSAAPSSHIPPRRRHAERVRRSPPVIARDRAFTLTDKYQGQSFFDGWDFFDFADPTHGSVEYVNRDKAFANGLAFVRDNVAFMKVDNSTFLPEGTNRQSVRITSKKTFNGGLFIVDMLAMPHGCSVWPAFWTVGPNWPSGGEIDILEGVHDQPTNQYTLHTSDGCTLDASKKVSAKDSGRNDHARTGSGSLSGFTGEILSTTCNAAVNFNAGCGILDSDRRTYGHEFNVNRGGVYAMLWDDSGVSIWFFARGSIPGDIDAGKPSPGGWGLPKAFWSSSSCSTNQFFRDHAMVFDITLCGDWAGATYGSAGCPGTCAQRVTDPNNFLYANWQVNYVSVYN